jgi:hypothetical protein
MVKQRSTKIEKECAEQVLQGLWESAYNTGSYSITFDDELTAKRLHEALTDYRKKINRKKLENLPLYNIIQACILKKGNENGQFFVKIERKYKLLSDRTSLILSLNIPCNK